MYVGQAYSSPEDALQHFGVKGMKWGVRKDRGTTQRPTRSPAPESQGMSRNKKIALAAGATVLLGAAVAGAVIASNGRQKYDLLPTSHTPEVANLVRKGNIAKKMGVEHRKVANHVRGSSQTRQDYERLAKKLKKKEYLRWDDANMMYVKSQTEGYNPNTGKLGPKGYAGGNSYSANPRRGEQVSFVAR